MFERKVITLVCRRGDLHSTQYIDIFVFGYYFSCWHEMYSLSIWKLSSWKVPVFGRKRTIVILRDKRLRVECYIQNVRFLNDCVLFISTMICFAFDGKNDSCWMVFKCSDTFSTSRYCSVIRLSCLDELLNNDIFFWLFISVICVICLAKRIQ